MHKTKVEFESFSFFSNSNDDQHQERCRELCITERVRGFNLFCGSSPQEACVVNPVMLQHQLLGSH